MRGSEGVRDEREAGREGVGVDWMTGVEVMVVPAWDVTATGSAQLRDVGIVLFSVISAHFTSSILNITLIRHGPRPRYTSSPIESGSKRSLLGINSSSPSMLQVYSPA